MDPSFRIIANPFHSHHSTDDIHISGELYHTNELPKRANNLAESLKAHSEIILPADYGLQPIQAVHDNEYLDFLRSSSESLADSGLPMVLPDKYLLEYLDKAYPDLRKDTKNFALDDGTPILAGTWKAASIR